jgi:K+ transporter
MLFGKFHYKNNPERVKITEKRVLRANTLLRTMQKSERKLVNKIAMRFAAHYKDYKLSEEMGKKFKHVAEEGTTLSEYVKLTIFFQHRTADAILHNLKHNQILHERVILATVETLAVPRVPGAERLEIADLGKGFLATGDSGAVTAPNDPSWDRLQAVAKAARSDPSVWLAMEDIYGAVGRSPVFAQKFAQALNALWADGVAATLTRYLAGKL